jgi:hypothetical protein
MSNTEKHFYSSSLTGVERSLYRVGYTTAIQAGETPDEAHRQGLKQIAKLHKLRALSAKGQIFKH